MPVNSETVGITTGFIENLAKDNPELMKELAKEIQEQKEHTSDATKQAVENELGFVEETPTAV